MPSSKEKLGLVLEKLSGLDGVAVKTMMGEYMIYYGGKLVGGVYDDRFLVKQTKSSKAMLPYAPLERPYDGAKEMLSADGADRELLNALIPALAADLPAPKKKA
ncbi:MAG: TfoX/Sxy family protein [Clostridia bacterium]|nr:TfoX/Sxy family protein [Clostridia bacterium]